MKRRIFLRSLFLGSMASALLPLEASASSKTYRVQKGDTLSSIARRHGIKLEELQAANPLAGDRIRVDQNLSIPSPTTAAEALARVKRVTEQIAVPLRPWTMVVGHHSAVERGNAAIYDRGHRERGMKDGLAYHFVIGNGQDSGDGEIEVGERWVQQLPGGHVRQAAVNAFGIGICLVGNFEYRKPSSQQMRSFVALVDYLRREVMRQDFRFAVHKEVDPGHTVCPGRHFPLKAMHRRFG